MSISVILYPVLIVGVIGLIFGCLLAFAAIVFAVKTDEREELIIAELPGANCGACGYAGCSAYAAAVVNDGAPVNACSVGKDAVAKKIAEIMGVTAEEVEEKAARVMCMGTCDVAINKYEYHGITDCVAAARLAGGAKGCPSGCLGLGSCISVCKFGAISVVNGVAVIDEDKCTACGMCINKCPKHIIKFVPKKNKVWVPCSNNEKGVLTKQYCSVGCLGCKMCEKVCPSSAIKVTENFASIDYNLCTNCGECALKCPKKVIKTTLESVDSTAYMNV